MTAVGPVIYAVYVNGSPISELPLDARLEQTWACHDLYSVRIEYNRTTAMSSVQTWPTNALVSIVWGRKPGTLNIWYGYLNHYEMNSQSDSGTNTMQITYYCIGTSKPMNSVNSFVWGSVSPTYIAKQMAQKYHLRCVYTSTTTVLTAETQANMSDFNYMNSLADKTGYRFWVSGGTLYFIDPTVFLTGTTRQAVPIYTLNKSLTQQDTLRTFKLLQGDNLPGSTVATRTISGIDSTSGSLFTASTTGSTTSSTTLNNSTRVVQSYGEAQDILAAWEGLSQFWIGAEAEVYGDTSLYPGKIVYLNGNAMTTGNAGYWIVAHAEQILLASGTNVPTSDKYVTRCVLMRNTLATVPTSKQTVIINPEFTTCVASNGVWYSTNQQVIANGIING